MRFVRDRLLLPALGVLAVLAVWEATRIGYGLTAIVLPSPWQVAGALFGLLTSRPFWRDVGVSLYEFAAGYLIGGVLGIAIGGLLGEWRRARMTMAPVIESLRFIVPFAWIPLTVLWFGTHPVGKIFLVGYAVFFVMVVSTTHTILGMEPTLSRVGTMLGMRRYELAWRVHLRAAAPAIASAARAAAAIGWIAVVAAEYVGASAGLGVLITNAASSLATPVVIAGMLVIGLIGAGVSGMIGWASGRWLDYR